MKSLNSNFTNINSDFFDKKVLDHLLNEGFEFRHTCDSYNRLKPESSSFACYFKYAGKNGYDWPIYVYVCVDGIRVDLDYDCGGNYNNMLFEYNLYSNFEECYDAVVDYVNDLKR